MCRVHMSQACLLSHAAFPQTGLQVLCVGINTEVATVRGPCGSPPPCVAQPASYLTRSADCRSSGNGKGVWTDGPPGGGDGGREQAATSGISLLRRMSFSLPGLLAVEGHTSPLCLWLSLRAGRPACPVRSGGTLPGWKYKDKRWLRKPLISKGTFIKC